MKKGTADHPKTVDLAEHLKINRAWVCGILELLWNFTRDYAPEGDVGRFSDAAIARALHWTKTPTTLIDSLVKFRWLDRCPVHRLVIHDWDDHCDDYTRKKLKRSDSDFVPCLKKSGQCPDKVQTISDPESRQFSTHARAEPLPVPLPVPEPLPFVAAHAAEQDFTLSPSDVVDAVANGNGTKRNRDVLDETISETAAAIWERHPKLRRDISANEVAKKLRVIAKTVPASEREALIATVNQNHAGWCESPSWTKDGSQFAKSLENWLAPTMNRYRAEPPPPGEVFVPDQFKSASDRMMEAVLRVGREREEQEERWRSQST